MATGKMQTEPKKLSPEFMGRLRRLPPQKKVRAIVLLVSSKTRRNTRRQTPAERKAAVAAVRESAEENLARSMRS